MKNRVVVIGSAGVAWIMMFSSLLPQGVADTERTNLDKKVADFTLKDINGHEVSLSSFKDRKAIVVVFAGTECPINNQYMARLTQFHKTYAEQGVQFLAINSNRQDTAQRVAEHAKQ